MNYEAAYLAKLEGIIVAMGGVVPVVTTPTNFQARSLALLDAIAAVASGGGVSFRRLGSVVGNGSATSVSLDLSTVVGTIAFNKLFFEHRSQSDTRISIAVSFGATPATVNRFTTHSGANGTVVHSAAGSGLYSTHFWLGYNAAAAGASHFGRAEFQLIGNKIGHISRFQMLAAGVDHALYEVFGSASDAAFTTFKTAIAFTGLDPLAPANLVALPTGFACDVYAYVEV